ncbi:Trans-zeatin O-beta-D-glucosyltransferase [Bertholletia excelsa]
MTPGHFIPMLDMAKLLAQQGVVVSLVAPPVIASRYAPILDRAIGSGLAIQLLELRFPSVEAGLPEGCETLDAIPSIGLMKNYLGAIDMLQQPFEELFQDLKPWPSCIIADKNLVWAAETAKRFQIPRVIFDGMSCFTLLTSHYLHASKVHEDLPETEHFVVPGLPDRIELIKAQLPGSFNPVSYEIGNFHRRVREAEEEAYGMVVNSFEELEPRYVEGLRKVKGYRVWCIGPLSLGNKDILDKAQRGNKPSVDENRCLEWLDAHEPGSVVYACLGSVSRLTPPQLIELGSGLEASNRPFIWVVRAGTRGGEFEKWIKEDGFEKRTKGRGLIIRGWAPQVLILSHRAIGAFLTHCGWNSTLEGVCAGLPMVTWPLFAEQFLNEKLVLQVLGTGVGVGARVVVHLFEEERFGVLVKREAVKEAVKKVMDEGIEGEDRRNKARMLGEMAKRAIEEGGSSSLNMTLLVQDIMKQLSDKGTTQKRRT